MRLQTSYKLEPAGSIKGLTKSGSPSGRFKYIRIKSRVLQILSTSWPMFAFFSAAIGTKSSPISFLTASKYCLFTRSTLFKTEQTERTSYCPIEHQSTGHQKYRPE